MSLLSKPKMITRWKKTLLVIVSILLLVPCVAAATFNMRFDLESVLAQDPAQEELRLKVQETEVDKQKREIKAKFESLRERAERLNTQKERIANDPELRKKQVEQLKELDAEMAALKMRAALLEEANQKERIYNEAFETEFKRRREVELEMKEITQAAMVRLARINMDQAIQIATSQYPGKVTTANLGAKGWEEPGKLARDGVVFYHVVVVDEVNGDASHVFVNAVDGSIIKTEKEKRREPRSEKP